jgi:hypothetical protein
MIDEVEERGSGDARSLQEMLADAYMSRVRKIDKDLGLNNQLSRQPRVSTGLLCADMVLGNGFVPGFNIFVGEEQSAKSTASMTTLGASLQRPIPIRKYFDAEGAVDMRYTGNILGVDEFSDVFGQQDRTGRWIKPAHCLYYDTNIIEEVFRDIHRMTAFMPDKIYREDAGEWFLRFGRTREEVGLLKELKLSPDKALYRSTGQYWCSVGDDDAPQAMVFIDSIPALIPKDIDEEAMSDKGRAIEARFLGKYMKLVRGKLRPKAVVLMAVNQLRSNPDSGPGAQPFYETGGNVMKFASDSRTMWSSRVPQDNFPRFAENKGLCEEQSVEFPGGTDLYAFKGITNIKNKYGQPKRKSMARVWIKDGDGEPRGFDPVYDTWKFLDTLGLCSAKPSFTDKRKTFRLDIPRIADVDFTWPLFKAYVIAQADGNKRLLAAAAERGAPTRFRLRDYCFHMIRSGKSEELLSRVATAKNTGKLDPSMDIEAEGDGDGGDE